MIFNVYSTTGIINKNEGLKHIILNLSLFIVIFSIFNYFLVLKPQQKKSKAHQDLLKSIKKGDSIITSAGIVGIVSNINNDLAFVEIAPKVIIKILKNTIINVKKK